MIPIWTHNITTMTGYFYGFAGFSYIGFVVFFILGYIGGMLYSYGKFSILYEFIYLLLLTKIHSLFSHGIQYYFTVFESVVIFFIPFIYFYIYKKRITVSFK